MNSFMISISQLAVGALNSFRIFPAAMISAVAFALVTIIRINMDWPQQEPYNFLFNCLHLSLALAAIFSLAAITWAHSRKSKAFLLVNLLGIIAAIVAFLSLYYYGGTDPNLTDARYVAVSGIAAARVTVAMIISFLCFMVLAGYPDDQSDFAHSSVMTLKAFVIALVYGGVIMAGLSGVAGAFQALLYNAMSEKIYMYLATLSGFLSFAIFVGYFPDFRMGARDEQRITAQEQPRFMEILFGTILIPIVLALTVVLLIWTVKTVVTGDGVSFSELSSIATSYAIGGIWLYIMVTHHESRLAAFYKATYPWAALVILAFEARALWIQLAGTGLKTEEYWFALIWVMAVTAAVFLLVKQAKAFQPIVVITCVLAVVSILPATGYNVLPVQAQTNRLEKILVSHNMLKDNKIVPAPKEPALKVRESITDAVSYLAYVQDAKLPAWFDKKLGDNQTFKSKMGFEQVWPAPEPSKMGRSQYLVTSLYKPAAPLDISGYRWMVNPQENFKEPTPVSWSGERGAYQIYWTIKPPNGIPSVKITLNDKTILEDDLNAYIDRITKKYPPGTRFEPQAGSLEDMIVKFETPELRVMLVFNNIDVSVNPRDDVINYGFGLDAIYLQEKP